MGQFGDLMWAPISTLDLGMTTLDTWLRAQYSSLPNHNYGWWLITREHQDVATLLTAVQYLYSRFGELEGTLSGKDYANLQGSLGRVVPAAAARTVLNRHLLLNMWRPLRLLERGRDSRINPFRLAEFGLELAKGTEPRRVFESILREIRFVDPRWTRPGVLAEYSGIEVRPHHVLNTVLVNVEGYLTRTEYRLFVARLRRDDESTLEESIDLIKAFRGISNSDRASLASLERPLFPTPKSHQNWVDMDLHTFSLFALGTQFRRSGTVLVLAGTPVDATVANSFVYPEGSPTTQATVPTAVKSSTSRKVSLKTPASNPDLDLPPTPSIAVNSGQEAEGFIRRMLEANGFEVRDFSRFRGYGFDLWARHLSTSVVYYCEVKSSTGTLGSIEFTRLEVEAADKYRERYVVFCVEHFNAAESAGDVWTVQDPWIQLPSIQVPKASETYSSPRVEWRATASKLL